MTKYDWSGVDWSLAPNWAIAWAMDKSGECYWHSGSHLPIANKDIFESSFDGHTYEAPCFNYKGNWQDSLEERPAETDLPETVVKSLGEVA